MAKKTVVCPSCGADNIQGDVCAFCGSKLHPAVHVGQMSETMDGENFSDEYITQKIDKYENKKTIYSINFNHPYPYHYPYLSLRFSREISANGEDRLMICLENKNRENIRYSPMFINLGNSSIEVKPSGGRYSASGVEFVQYEINQEILDGICEANPFSFKINPVGIWTDEFRTSYDIDDIIDYDEDKEIRSDPRIYPIDDKKFMTIIEYDEDDEDYDEENEAIDVRFSNVARTIARVFNYRVYGNPAYANTQTTVEKIQEALAKKVKKEIFERENELEAKETKTEEHKKKEERKEGADGLKVLGQFLLWGVIAFVALMLIVWFFINLIALLSI